MANAEQYTIKELTSSTWSDFETLFGKHGAADGCWCMFFRQTSQDYKDLRGEANKRLMHELVDHSNQIGLMAYDGDKAVGWCAVAPRSHYIRIEKILDGRLEEGSPIWSIVCFYTAKGFRHKGITRFLIQKAVEMAKARGAKTVEAYPSIPKEDKIPDSDGYTGFYDVFIKLGFHEVMRVKPEDPVLRIDL